MRVTWPARLILLTLRPWHLQKYTNDEAPRCNFLHLPVIILGPTKYSLKNAVFNSPTLLLLSLFTLWWFWKQPAIYKPTKRCTWWIGCLFSVYSYNFKAIRRNGACWLVHTDVSNQPSSPKRQTSLQPYGSVSTTTSTKVHPIFMVTETTVDKDTVY